MKKLLILIATILLLALAVSAQTRTKGEIRTASEKKERTRASLVVKLGPSTTYIKNGLSIREVVRLLGQPASISERRDGALRLSTYTFPRSSGRMLVADFEDGLLVSSRTESNQSLVQNSETPQ